VLLVLLPPLGLLIRLDSPGPLFHCQERLGKNGRKFKMYKFRSMRVDAEADGKAQWACHNDMRVTRVGRFLRATHLDELPQVLNILRGEMSLIGPRPEREEFVALLEKTIPFYRCRLSVPPGLTGWAQVKYHYTFTSQQALEKLQYDLYYIKHQSYILDILIILRTVIEVIKLRGV
jgi:lipopolysaccharide/colanic/teichoic acid biosynthesis glycosyltransferase